MTSSTTWARACANCPNRYPSPSAQSCHPFPRGPHQAARRRGRPRLGGIGAANVLISIEPTPLKRADQFARKKGLSRSALFSRGVELALGT
jgi:hypothetical protein